MADEPASNDAAAPNDTPPPPQPQPPRRLRGRHVAFSFAGFATKVLVLLALLGGALWWLLDTPQGTAWLLARTPLQVVGASGKLLGDFQAQSVAIALPGQGGRLTIEGLHWQGLRVTPATGPLWLRVHLRSLRAARIDVRPGKGDGSVPPAAPQNLKLPLAVDIDDLHVGALHIAGIGDAPLRDIRAQLHLGAAGGSEHRIDGLRFDWDRLHVDGHAGIGTRGDLPLQAQFDVNQTLADGGTWKANLALTGPLAAAQLEAHLRARVKPEAAEQSLDARATLHPFAAWPLGALTAHTRALDLAALSASAPTTQLDIDARVESSGLNEPALVALELRNHDAGRWNEGRLPLRSATLEVSARPDDVQRLELKRFDVALGSRQTEAGRIRGSGEWHAGQWQLDTRIDGLLPQALDARAPAMAMGGQLALHGSGFDLAALDKAAVDVRGQLQGRQLDGRKPVAARNVQLKLDARLGLLRIELREALARAGEASAELSGTLTRRATDAPWRVEGKAALHDFDPKPWWPGDTDSPWRRGPHRLNADADFALQLPAATNESPQALIGALRGELQLKIEPSRLAGVPLSGNLTLRETAGAPAKLALQLDVDGNQLHADAALQPVGPGADDHWQLHANMPQLHRLQPIWGLFGSGKLAGALQLEGTVDGRWPRLRSRGRLKASELQVSDNRVRKASAHWQLGSRTTDAFEAQVDLNGLTHGPATAATATLRLDGTVGAHRLDVRVDSKSLPPAWAETLRAAPGAAASKHTLAQLQASGGFIGTTAQAMTGWRGEVQRIDVRGDGAGAEAWLNAQDVQLALQWDAGPPRIEVSQGRADVLGAVLRFGPIRWRAAQGVQPALLQAQAELDPLAVAPILKRVQPAFGWGGDLLLRGHLMVRSTPAFSADVIIERAGGDLSVTDDAGTRSLGLSDLRVALNADGGTWNFSTGLAGKTLGEAAGALVVQASPRALWPAQGAPLQGVLELRVADLGVWGPWLPPGWRLSGDVHAGVDVGGRLGAPEFTGQVTGASIGVRNVLQGVDVHDGSVSIALKGDSARIEHFEARAGDGRLTLAGGAELGATPHAELQLALDKFELLGRVDRRIVTSGNAQLRLGKDTLALDGEIKVDEGLIDFSRSEAPALSSDVMVTRAGDRPIEEPAAAGDEAGAPPKRNIDLNLRVRLGDKLRLRGNGLDAELRGDLLVTAPRGKLRVNGSVRVVNGTYKAYRQNLVIDRGVITFNGPLENPQLDIEATRPNLDVRVGVAVTGTALLPRIRLFSEPAMSDVDKLSWLLRGRASEGPGSADTAVLQAAALALASGDEPGKLDQLLSTLGLDELSVSDGNGTTSGTVVSVGKQLSRNWFVGYERSLNSAAGNWQLIYRIAQRFTVRAQSGTENSIALIWSWRWQ